MISNILCIQIVLLLLFMFSLVTTGIISRLDHLEYIGVEIIWLSPIYPSPMVDFGYDVSDFTDIEPMFGTLQDFDDLIKEVHKRGECNERNVTDMRSLISSSVNAVEPKYVL